MPTPASAGRSDAPEPDAPGRLRQPLTWVLVFLAVAAVAAGAWLTRGPAVPTGTAIQTDIAQHIVASGRVRVATRVELAAETSGRVVEVTVREGDRVRAGDVLLRLDATEASATVAEARASLDQATARLDQVRSVSAVVTSRASREAAVNLERAERELSRVRTLAAAGAIATATVEDAERAVEIARAQREAAEARDAATTHEGAEVSLAQAAVQQARAALAGAEARLDRTRITAPHDGELLTRAVEPGDTIQTGIVLFELGADGVTELVIEPDERNLAWIRVGQYARASADAFADDTFDAEVSYIAPAVDPARGSVEVRLRVPDPPAYLRPDMTVSVDLEVASKAGIVAVPSEAVRGNDDDTFVFVVDDNRVRRQPAETGIRGEGHTEIVSGLDAGTPVVLATPLALEDGDRVRPIDED